MEDKPTMTRAEKFVIRIGAAIVLLIVFLALLDYSGVGGRWMGFSESTTTKKTTNYDPSETKVKSVAYADDTQRAKTVWDWMQVAGFPLAVAAATFLWTQAAKRRDETTPACLASAPPTAHSATARSTVAVLKGRLLPWRSR